MSAELYSIIKHPCAFRLFRVQTKMSQLGDTDVHIHKYPYQNTNIRLKSCVYSSYAAVQENLTRRAAALTMNG
jgi:hypothetical protein